MALSTDVKYYIDDDTLHKCTVKNNGEPINNTYHFLDECNNDIPVLREELEDRVKIDGVENGNGGDAVQVHKKAEELLQRAYAPGLLLLLDEEESGRNKRTRAPPLRTMRLRL